MTSRYLLLVLGVATLLAGCGRISLIQSVDIGVAFEPTAFGYEVDDDGDINVASHVVTFTSRPGSMGATIEGYRIEYFDSSGNPLAEGDSILYDDGALDVIVPPGIECEEPDAFNRCSVNSSGASFAPVQAEPVGNFITLTSSVVIQHLMDDPTGARGDVYFYGVDDRGKNFTLGPIRVAIVNPVGG